MTGDGELCLVKLKCACSDSFSFYPSLFLVLFFFPLHFDFCKLFFAILIETDISFSVNHLHCEQIKKKNRKCNFWHKRHQSDADECGKVFSVSKLKRTFELRQTSKPNRKKIESKQHCVPLIVI